MILDIVAMCWCGLAYCSGHLQEYFYYHNKVRTSRICAAFGYGALTWALICVLGILSNDFPPDSSQDVNNADQSTIVQPAAPGN